MEFNKEVKATVLKYLAINIETLEIYFRDKFEKSEIVNDYVQAVTEEVDQQYARLCADDSEGFHRISDAKIRKYITKLKRGCASGHDGILAEHLKNAVKTKLVLHLSNLLSICVTHGIVPESFLTGTMVPILKKVNADASKAESYRPITISVVYSKLLELHILDQCSDYEFSPSQFGFVPERGTDMAIALAHDVSSYCWSRGTAVFLCSLN